MASNTNKRPGEDSTQDAKRIKINEAASTWYVVDYVILINKTLKNLNHIVFSLLVFACILSQELNTLLKILNSHLFAVIKRPSKS